MAAYAPAVIEAAEEADADAVTEGEGPEAEAAEAGEEAEEPEVTSPGSSEKLHGCFRYRRSEF